MRLAYTDAISVFEIEWSDNDDDGLLLLINSF